jgi:lysophospholipase L1-like esterase
VLALLGVLAGIGAVELTLRALYDEPWYDQLTGEQANVSALGYRRNAFGLRDDPYPVSPPTDHRRVLVLGDSFTFGLGVHDDAAIFTERLQVLLNEGLSIPGVEHVNVLNGGISGSYTREWLALTKRVARVYEPDLVLMVFFLRDGTRTRTMTDFFGPVYEEITASNKASPLYRYSFIWRRIRDNLDRVEVGERYTLRFQRSYFGDENETSEWRAAQRNLRAIRARARARGIDVGLVIFPVLVQLDESYPFLAIHALLVEFAQENEISVLDLLPAFLGQQGPDLWVARYDQHPNAEGHRIAAEAMAPFVSELLLAAEAERER